MEYNTVMEKKTQNASIFDTDQAKRWELVCAFNCPSFNVVSFNRYVPNMRDIESEIMDEVWKFQDGYGEVGYTPSQGWDWSGIRDSSDEAYKNMVDAVVRVMKKHEVWSINFTRRF